MDTTSFELFEGEILVRQGKATYLATFCDVKKMKTYLTNLRFVMWGKDDSSFLLTGVAWLFIVWLIDIFRKNRIVLELPIASIEDVVIKKTGFTRKLVLTVDGKKHHIIMAQDTDLWMEDIRRMMGSSPPMGISPR